jgi:signal transduction histidine kinase
VTQIAERTSEVLLALPPEPGAARKARRALHEARMPEDLEHTVELLTTELIANAVRHAELEPNQKITLYARAVDDFIRVDIHNPGPPFDADRAREGKGYGLRMVDMLSSRWGVDPGGCGSRSTAAPSGAASTGIRALPVLAQRSASASPAARSPERSAPSM